MNRQMWSRRSAIVLVSGVYFSVLFLKITYKIHSVRASLEEKKTRVFAIALAIALALFQYPERTKVATG